MSRARKRPHLGWIICAARYWQVSPALHRSLLQQFTAGGERPTSSDIPADVLPMPAEQVPERDRARILWEDGGVRNLDVVSMDVARAWLAQPREGQE